MTHRASWIDLSASSSTNLLLPLMMIEQVLPGVAIPVIFTHLELPVCISSTRSALARFSAVKWSRDAMGRHPMVLHRKSTSSLSMSFTTMIFILSKKWTARSERPSLRMDFWMRRTLQPAFFTCFTMLRIRRAPREELYPWRRSPTPPPGCPCPSWGRYTELDEANLGLLHSLGAIDIGSLLLEDHTIHKFSVVHSATQLLDNLDVLQIDIVLPCRVNHLEHSIHSNWAEFRAVLRDNLGVEAGVSRLQERLPVSEVKWGGHAGEDIDSLARRLLEALRDGGGVDSLLQQLVCGVQKRSGSHND